MAPSPSAVGGPLRIASTLLLALAAAQAAEALRSPLPWLIGPLLVTAAAGVAGLPLAAWAPLRNAGQWAIGVALGTSPGGIAEMCITAKVLQLGVPVVTAFHVVRYAAVLTLTSPFFAWEARRRGTGVSAGRERVPPA